MLDDFEMIGIFPCPIYVARRDSILDSTEEKEIEDIIKEGLHKDGDLGYHSNNSHIFDTKLKNLKEFCEQHIKNYVKEIITPKEELDFYITQSWLNVVEPGGSIHRHWHANSIISGVFYPTVEEDDQIHFQTPNARLKERMFFEAMEYNPWNSSDSFFAAEKNNLMLFPSWLEHSVRPNEKATRDRISISFNVFVRGIIGTERTLDELILK